MFATLKRKYSVSFDNILNKRYSLVETNISFYFSISRYTTLQDPVDSTYPYVITFYDFNNELIDSSIFQKDIDLLGGIYNISLFSDSDDPLTCNLFSDDYV